ncbi:mandelate racemase/muconate lactonizing enzyme family protein [Pigmentiphaga sp.]|uniref:mandelate racemase/muconate lactonizing enzyme family protein n=1 Tax=Pigmentiphaga sp. TaxID=1977564 RepID=UPI0025DFB818|nr:mandelate racemase/muconate lactonizing enzyme family protein [Pigmentiphaga sp.]
MSTIAAIELHRLSLPLPVPYKVSNLVFRSFDPIVVAVRDRNGAQGWAETVVGPGYTDETDEEAWAFCREWAGRLLQQDTEHAKACLARHLERHSHAASIMISAIEMAEGNRYLQRREPARVPLLVPLQQQDEDGLGREVERLLAQGYATFKVKIGFDVGADLRRVGWIQQAVRGRARLRLDANQAYTVEQARAFLAELAPTDIELLEQPCDKHDWAANARVAADAPVPIMLDESIYTLADVERAAGLAGVAFVKVKINKLGGVQRLGDGLLHIGRSGLRPVLGNGVATDISCWMEAAVASHTIDTTGEMNGWLKLPESLLRNPVRVEQGAMCLPAGYWPVVDTRVLESYALESLAFAPASVAAGPVSTGPA